VLYEKYGHRVVYDTQIKVEARLSTVLRERNCNWRPTRSNELVEIQSRLSLVEIGGKRCAKMGDFKIKKILKLRNMGGTEREADASGMVEVDLVFFSHSKASLYIVVGYERCIDNKGQTFEMGL
jgi:hypothetical protein